MVNNGVIPTPWYHLGNHEIWNSMDEGNYTMHGFTERQMFQSLNDILILIAIKEKDQTGGRSRTR